jgi:hypothetical protein
MHMKWPAVVPTLLLLLAACAGFPFLGRTELALGQSGAMDTPGQTDGGASSAAPARVELQNVRYDGRMVTGRLLVGAVAQSLTLDRRIIESIYLTTESVSDCATSQPVGFVAMDVYAQRPREEDILVLNPGYWYGKDVSILLFSEDPGGPPAPACIEADFVFRQLGGRPAASVHVRAVREAQPVPDAGTAADAGSEGPRP